MLLAYIIHIIKIPYKSNISHSFVDEFIACISICIWMFSFTEYIDDVILSTNHDDTINPIRNI